MKSCATWLLVAAAATLAMFPVFSAEIPRGQRKVPKWIGTDMPINSSYIALIKIQNMEVKFSCENNLVPKPTIQWLKNGKPFEERPMGKVVQRGYSLKLIGLLAAFDKGNYTCIVNNSFTEMSRTFDLDIIIQHRGPPEFTVVPENRTAFEGDDVELNCRYISGAAAYVRWVKHYMVNGSHLSSNGKPYEKVVQSGPGSESDPGQLLLRNLTLSDSGWYTCIVSNQDNQSVNRSAWLDVLPAHPTMPQSLLAGYLTDHNIIAICFGAGAAIVIVSIVVGAVVYLRVQQHRHQIIPWSKNALYGPMPSFEPIDSEWEFSRENLVMGDIIGEGNFGKVHKAFATGLGGRQEPVTVAVKMLRNDATIREKDDLLSEIEMMKMIGQHINIINFLGCCTRSDGPIQVIVEFAPFGNLREYLQSKRPLRMTPYGDGSETVNQLMPKDLISFSFQVARGMEYLASQKIVHRDLAARNVLVSDDHILKISDFGLTRHTKEKDYYQRVTNGRLPVKWMAIESLTHNRYTTKSDVWSYGILLWEIFTYGENPYPSVPVENLLQTLRGGHRLEKPSEASDDIYELMLRCWLLNPSDRPCFSDLILTFEQIMTESLNINYLNLQSLSETEETVGDSDSRNDTNEVNGLSVPPLERPAVTYLLHNSYIQSP